MSSQFGTTAIQPLPDDSRPARGTVWPEMHAARRADAGERRINIDSENLKNGLTQLVLTLVKLLHELLEKQALRRIESGRLRDDDCERVGLALMKQSEQIEKLREAFGLSEQDLNLDLGPLGRLL